jgi:hypothetical protein
MNKFEIRKIKKSDTFYSEYNSYKYDKTSLFGKLMDMVGMNEVIKLSRLSCIDNFILNETNFKKYLNNKITDSELILVSIYKQKIVGLIMFSLSSSCNPTNNCFHIMISNPFLCYEKDIMSNKDVIHFMEKSLSMAKNYYLPYYNKLKNIVKSYTNYKDIITDMYIFIIKDQVDKFSNTVMNIYKQVGFTSLQNGYMFYSFKEPPVWFYNSKNNKNVKLNKSISRSRSRSRSRSKNRKNK